MKIKQRILSMFLLTTLFFNSFTIYVNAEPIEDQKEVLVENNNTTEEINTKKGNDFNVDFDDDFIKTVDLVITDLDEETLEPIKNHEVSLINEKGEVIFTGYTDENGQVLIKNLPEGKYKYRNTKVSGEYNINDNEFDIELTKKGEVKGDTIFKNNKEKLYKREVLFIDIDTNEELGYVKDDNWKYRQEYEVPTANYEGIYELVSIDDPGNGVITQDTYIKVYYRKIKQDVQKYTLTINYIDKDTNEVLKTESNTYEKDSEYKLDNYKELFTGYIFNSIDGNETGKITDNTTINIYYNKEVKKEYTLKINYIDEDTKEVLKTKEVKIEENGEYTIDKENIAGYTFSKIDGEEKGKITEDKEINLYYKKDVVKEVKKNYVLTINYIDSETKKVIQTELKSYEENSKYDIKDSYKIELKGYEYEKVDGELSGEITKDTVINVYYKQIKPVENKVVEPVQTGDNNPVMLYAGIGVLALITLIGILIKKKFK